MKNVFELVANDWRKEGLLEGERNGKRKGALEIADKLIAKGMSVNDVADATGLTVDEILQR
jgi:predicted transposase/invertase (TIGR01784 family)